MKQNKIFSFMSCNNLKVSYHLWVRVENHKFILKSPKIVGVIWLLVGSKLPDSYTQGSNVRRSERGTIPHRHFEIKGESFICDSLGLDEPTSYEEALASPTSHEWIVAMKDEMDSMAKNQVWELVNLLPRHKTIGNKWVFEIKHKADGSIDKYKARLMAKGYTQREGQSSNSVKYTMNV